MDKPEIAPDSLPIPTELDDRLLSLAVIAQAVEDISCQYPTLTESKGEAEKVRGEAISFLTTANKDLAFWCERAELNPESVVKRARLILKEQAW